MIAERLYYLAESNGWFSHLQAGFRKGCGCENQILKITQGIEDAFHHNPRKVSVLVLLDIRHFLAAEVREINTRHRNSSSHGEVAVQLSAKSTSQEFVMTGHQGRANRSTKAFPKALSSHHSCSSSISTTSPCYFQKTLSVPFL